MQNLQIVVKSLGVVLFKFLKGLFSATKPVHYELKVMSIGAIIAIYFVMPRPQKAIQFEEIPAMEEVSAAPKSATTNSAMTVSYKKKTFKPDPARLAYIQRFQNVAIAEMRKYNILASISLAQGILESNSGRSKLATEHNNHFGVKCFSKTCKKGHCVQHADDKPDDMFRAYQSAWESWRHHSLVLKGNHYKSLFLYPDDYVKFAKGLQKFGYATNTKYAETLIEIIENYNLTQYDEYR